MRKSIQKILNYKPQNKKITVLTAYDYSTAKYADLGGVDMILVGDSLAQVVLGLDNTSDISMNEMKIFVRAVSRGVENALLIADMPYMSFQIDKSQTVQNACELIKAGANAVKLEGASDYIIDNIKHLTQIGIPVVGHIGFTPQSINILGGNKIQGKTASKAEEILSQAQKLQEAGCFAVVLELMPQECAKYVTQNIQIPTIGIGAGKFCDGQVLVIDDILGKFDKFSPRFVRKYADLKTTITQAVKQYCADVESGDFPNENECYKMEDEEREKIETH